MKLIALWLAIVGLALFILSHPKDLGLTVPLCEVKCSETIGCALVEDIPIWQWNGRDYITERRLLGRDEFQGEYAPRGQWRDVGWFSAHNDNPEPFPWAFYDERVARLCPRPAVVVWQPR